MKNRALGNSRDHNKISSVHNTGVLEEERVGLKEYSEIIMAEILPKLAKQQKNSRS